MAEKGFFDLPAVIFHVLQTELDHWLPAWLSIVLWALLASFLSMWTYRRLSNQAALNRLRPLQKSARQRLASYDGPFDGLPPLIKENLTLSGRQLWLKFYPTLPATLPFLFLLVWLSNHYGVYFPAPGSRVTMTVESDTSKKWRLQTAIEAEPAADGQWILRWPENATQLILLADDDRLVITLPPDRPSPVLHKRQWWNYLLANPAGYLDDKSVVEKIFLDLPEKEIITFGPYWLRGWLPLFLVMLIVFSLFFKWLWQLR